jgi:predicted XRE-type DNA-binding protein
MAIKKITKRKATQTEIDRHDSILEEIESREAKGEALGSLSVEMYSNSVDQFKWGICKEIMGLKVRQKLTSKKMAELMEVDKSKASQILNCRVDNFSVDRLLRCFLKLENIEKETDARIHDVLNLFSTTKKAV